MTSPVRLGVAVLLLALVGAATPAVGAAGTGRPDAAAPDVRRVVALDAERLGTRGRPPATFRVASPRKGGSTATQRVQHVTVRWKGTRGTRVYSRNAVVPGIGRLTMVCRPDNTVIRLTATDRSAETQMWMAKYETKNGRAVVATKTARIYRYAHAGDDGRGGTGSSASEGLNQRSRIEDFSSGYLDGVISQRPGRHRPVTGSARQPVTSFRLNWWWTGFRHPMSWRSCKMDAVFTTKLRQRITVGWHGEADAATSSYEEHRLPGIGTLQVRCEPDLGGDGRQSVALVPAARGRGTSAWVETVTGEGLVEDHVDAGSHAYDPATDLLGPFELPRNGMMRLFFTVAGHRRGVIVSSYHVVNDTARPHLNLCETAVGAL